MILDTCALLWLAVDQSKLSRKALDLIETTPQLSASAISAFEISQKYKHGQLDLPLPPKPWFERLIEQHRLTVVDLTIEISIAATELPDIHKDPFDRLIIATALCTGRPVITNDAMFERYGVETIS